MRDDTKQPIDANLTNSQSVRRPFSVILQEQTFEIHLKNNFSLVLAVQKTEVSNLPFFS